MSQDRDIEIKLNNNEFKTLQEILSSSELECAVCKEREQQTKLKTIIDNIQNNFKRVVKVISA
jgi:hypothetical protein